MMDEALERLQRGGGGTDEERDAALHDFIDGLDERFGEHPPCPVCGGTDWHATSSPISLLAGQGSVGTVLQAAMFACQRCRFLRLHVLNPLL